jgi:hypothetical protein
MTFTVLKDYHMMPIGGLMMGTHYHRIFIGEIEKVFRQS